MCDVQHRDDQLLVLRVHGYGRRDLFAERRAQQRFDIAGDATDGEHAMVVNAGRPDDGDVLHADRRAHVELRPVE